ncbi:MAG: vitamin B12-dependent ribonucleotide reductase [Candidatus Saccharimonadales bacterium]
MDSIDTGLGLKRHFTTKGVHPYTEVEWDRRDARITSYIDGKVAFEQKDVEFPVSWSQNATNIVAQKYFSGTPGESDRENSLRQLIDRVADTITTHGLEKHYFTDEEESEVFNHELKHLLVHQKAAFNSPVWFNIGVKNRSQQASACFILAVEDTMESILNWYTEEGMIFKGGSGAGINISSIRSSEEGLSSSGGKASGPVSFMRGADSIAGTIKSGGKTRRAAKMVILNVDHPDVEEFITLKAREEDKIRALREAGFDVDFDGRDTVSIQYQNANNSVRVSDDFMRAVEADGDWELKAVKDGQTVKTVKARELWQSTAQAAWECADPGLQFDTTINHWHTASNTGRINGSNPCSEYMHLDNSACNLASLNLLKFQPEGEAFDVASYKQAIEILFTAQEILVGYSSYPTDSIAQTAYDFRQLGLGYANLGALLMALGLPYDSEEGRAWAATLTGIMTGHAYATSARLARRVGPFAGYEKNREPMLKVLQQHREEVMKINPSLVPEELHSSAQAVWDEAVEQGKLHGVRNSQATVLAPTGTIGFMMDCDTTGVEPDLGLVKLKKLVGGGTMSIVNQTVPRALKNLGFNPTQVEDIIAYIDENKSIIGAPHIRPEHLPVFACSMGDNTIHYEGHIRMMGAVQPFISGAISKTVNMPEEASVEDVAEMHMLSWKLGLKAVAIYRDNCKVAQPLSMAKKEEKPANGPSATTPAAEAEKNEKSSEGFVVKTPVRRKLPRSRAARTFEFSVGGSKGFFTVGEYEDGKVGELFISMAKQGSTMSGLMDAFAISISNGLQYGVPLKFYVRKYMSMSFAPSGMTDDPEVPMASSVMDYIFRRLGLEYLPWEDRKELGFNVEAAEVEAQTTLAVDEPADEVPVVAPESPSVSEGAYGAGTPAGNPIAQESSRTQANPVQVKGATNDAPLCYNCGNVTVRSGSCHVCTACGTTTGCS